MDLVNHLEGRLLFAVPKKGRLNQATLNLLEGADIQFRRESRLDIALVKNLPIALVFLPAADIPTFVGEGQVDLGITGWDQVQEHDAGVKNRTTSSHGVSTPPKFTRRASREDPVSPTPKSVGDVVDAESNGVSVTASSQDTSSSTTVQGCETILDLGFGACKLQVQVPIKGSYKEPKDLIGKNIGTSFVHLTEKYFARLEAEEDAGTANGSGSETENGNGNVTPRPRKLRTQIIELSGSVEAACALGVADGIVDLVESGETMKAAGLTPLDTVVSSTAILIASKKPAHPQMVSLIASRIRGVITAQRYVLCQYNISRDRLAEATAITPGKRAATITQLDAEGWVAVSSMVEKKRIANAMDELAIVGATDILVLDIHNSRE